MKYFLSIIYFTNYGVNLAFSYDDQLATIYNKVLLFKHALTTYLFLTRQTIKCTENSHLNDISDLFLYMCKLWFCRCQPPAVNLKDTILYEIYIKYYFNYCYSRFSMREDVCQDATTLIKNNSMSIKNRKLKSHVKIKKNVLNGSYDK